MALVLVVDDEALVRMNAVDMIEHAGHQVIEAANADEAIRILESRFDIEIVFSDVTMPGSMDGLRLLHLIRHRWPPIRLILASGKSLPEGAKPPEGSVFLCKPYDLGDVTGALARAA
jgi:two-component system, response regulator PdtaR